MKIHASWSALVLTLAASIGISATAAAQSTCAPTHKINAIQGNAVSQLAVGAHDDVSPLNGRVVTIEGVVVGDFQSLPQSTRAGELRGFFIEEETADQDTDPSTSEGLFVFTGSFPTLDVHEGERICVRGPVSEFFGMSQITATAAGSLVLSAAGVALPEPATLVLPVVGDLNDYYEQYEGMRVAFAEPLYVSEYFEVARYGQIVLSQGGRPFQYTHPDPTPTQAEYAQFLDTLARRRIILDDDNNTQNAPLPAGVFFHPQPAGLATGVQGVDFYRGGDVIEHLVGVLHWSFAGQTGTDAWRVRPTRANPVTFSVRNPRPTRAPRSFGDIRVASFNVLNYFSTIDTTSSTTVGPCGRKAGYIDLNRLFEGRGAYSFVFDGQLGYLDHALANLPMSSQVVCASSWPINSDEVPVFDYNDTVRDVPGEATFEAEPTGNPLYEADAARTSDHDPVLIDINLCPRGAGQGVCLIRNLLTQLACRASHQ